MQSLYHRFHAIIGAAHVISKPTHHPTSLGSSSSSDLILSDIIIYPDINQGQWMFTISLLETRLVAGLPDLGERDRAVEPMEDAQRHRDPLN